MTERGNLKPEEKVKIAKKYLAGEVSICHAAAEAGVDRKTLQRWIMQSEKSPDRTKWRDSQFGCGLFIYLRFVDAD